MPKIMLDAGHYGKTFNDGVVVGYYESEQMWKLHKFLRDELLSYGIEVGLTRADQNKDLAVYERGKKAKGYDILLSLHSNSVSNSPSTNRVVVIKQLDGKGNEIAKKIGEAIVDTMALSGNFYLQATTKKASNGREYYGVLRGASDVGATALILEHSFHSNKEACKWLLKDENLKALAKAEAEAIADYYGVVKAEEKVEEILGKAEEPDIATELKQISDRLSEISLKIKGE